MIDIPIGKALVAVEIEGIWCSGCEFADKERCKADNGNIFGCLAGGKNVIFKLVDWPVKGEEE